MQTRLDEKEFKGLMAMLTKKYKYKMDDTELRMYWNRFKDGMDDKRFSDAVSQIMDTFVPSSQVPFPIFPHFLGAVGHISGNPLAKKAVNAVKVAVRRFGRYNSVNFGDSKIHQAIRYYGGWTKICDWTDKDWDLKEKGFIDTYNSMQSDLEFTHLVGLYERDNKGRYDVQPPKLVYKFMKELPVEKLEYKPSVVSIDDGKVVKEIADKFSLPDEKPKPDTDRKRGVA